MTAPTWLRHATTALACLLLLAGAGFFYSDLPTRAALSAPLDIKGRFNERVAGRNIAVTVKAVYTAPVIFNRMYSSKPPDRLIPDGRWIVVDFQYETVTEPSTVQPALMLNDMFLRPALTAGTRAAPGIPSRVTAAFDSPESPEGDFLLTAINANEVWSPSALGGTRMDSGLGISIPAAQIVDRPVIDLDNGALT